MKKILICILSIIVLSGCKKDQTEDVSKAGEEKYRIKQIKSSECDAIFSYNSKNLLTEISFHWHINGENANDYTSNIEYNSSNLPTKIIWGSKIHNIDWSNNNNTFKISNFGFNTSDLATQVDLDSQKQVSKITYFHANGTTKIYDIVSKDGIINFGECSFSLTDKNSAFKGLSIPLMFFLGTDFNWNPDYQNLFCPSNWIFGEGIDYKEQLITSTFNEMNYPTTSLIKNTALGNEIINVVNFEYEKY